MKKKFLTMLMLAFIIVPCLFLIGCVIDNPPDDNMPETEVTITYVLNGQTIETKKSTKSSINTPNNISLPGGYSLEGWYLDNNTFVNRLGYEDINETDFTVYAKVIELFTIQNKTLKSFSDADAISFVVPDGVEVIGEGVFEDNEVIQNVTLPSTLLSIERNAFYNCSSLKEIIIPNSTTYIGRNAFDFCSSLEEVQFPSGLETIEYRAFACTGIKNLITGANLKTIEEQAFYNCDELTSVRVRDTVETIGSQAFKHCGKLETVFLGTGLLTMEGDAFDECSALEAVYMYGENTEFSGYAFTDSQLYLVLISSQEILDQLNFSNAGYKLLFSDYIYIKEGLNPSEDLTERFTKTSNSNFTGYIKYENNDN